MATTSPALKTKHVLKIRKDTQHPNRKQAEATTTAPESALEPDRFQATSSLVCPILSVESFLHGSERIKKQSLLAKRRFPTLRSGDLRHFLPQYRSPIELNLSRRSAGFLLHTALGQRASLAHREPWRHSQRCRR
jgi:hypothetical protein